MKRATSFFCFSIASSYSYAFIGHTSAPRLQNSNVKIHEQSAETNAFDFEDALFLERFKRRVSSRSEQTPKEFVTALLSTLLTPHKPAANWGYEYLYTSSTEKWQYVLRRSVGASNSTEEDLIFHSLASSMERENQQFGILVGMGVDDGSSAPIANISRTDNIPESHGQKEYYMIEFPYDTLDYHDGTAWVECRLRNKQTDLLLVVIGWSLQHSGDRWLVDGMDWQDFREKYRPGIGREEWERICG
ncbi:hypothetical protein ACHAWO_007171 [Cyclotella atomus]|uniref:Nitroreductase domain-containing protein n=1 Tax=Cyclotella atomus TaxID=382360 RepID=A0ABD3N4E4_9STRA